MIYVLEIIAAITPDGSPFSTILYSPTHPTRVPIYAYNISQITFTLTDQNGNILNMNPNGTPETWNVVVSIEEQSVENLL